MCWLTSQSDAAVVEQGDFTVAIETMNDAAAEREETLNVPAEETSEDQESPLAGLREAADQSAAMVWAKDLDGRYVYVNPRFVRDLETSEERLLGKTDAEISPVETVDGPRLKYAADGLEEPLQLEYTVPPFEFRPTLAAIRFVLCDGSGNPVATCGVAAPSSKAHLAQDEAARLMQLERWGSLESVDDGAEVLERWDVDPAPTPSEPEPEPEPKAEPEPEPEPTAPQPDPASHHREDEWVRQLRQAAWIAAKESLAETSDALQSDLQFARKWAERADELQGELHQAHARIRQAETDAQQALGAAQLANEEASRWRTELEQLRLELERERAEAHAARSEVEVARHELGAARAQAESLRGPADAALRLSEELGRALAAERERGDELARTLARIRARLGDLESAFERRGA